MEKPHSFLPVITYLTRYHCTIAAPELHVLSRRPSILGTLRLMWQCCACGMEPSSYTGCFVFIRWHIRQPCFECAIVCILLAAIPATSSFGAGTHVPLHNGCSATAVYEIAAWSIISLRGASLTKTWTQRSLVFQATMVCPLGSCTVRLPCHHSALCPAYEKVEWCTLHASAQAIYSSSSWRVCKFSKYFFACIQGTRTMFSTETAILRYSKWYVCRALFILCSCFLRRKFSMLIEQLQCAVHRFEPSWSSPVSFHVQMSSDVLNESRS